MYKLFPNIQLPASKKFDSQILINYCTQNNDVSLPKELQKHMYKDDRKHGVVYQGKYRKGASKRKWTDREYHVQDNDDVAYNNVKMYCYTNQFTAC